MSQFGCLQRLHIKILSGSKTHRGVPLKYAHIIRLLDSFPVDDLGNKWMFAYQFMVVYCPRPEDLQYIHIRNGGKEICSNHAKSKGGKKGKNRT